MAPPGEIRVGELAGSHSQTCGSRAGKQRWPAGPRGEAWIWDERWAGDLWAATRVTYVQESIARVLERSSARGEETATAKAPGAVRSLRILGG